MVFSWFPALLALLMQRDLEVSEASMISGSLIGLGEALLDRGLWEHALIDPETAVGGGVILPIGSWVTGEHIFFMLHSFC